MKSSNKLGCITAKEDIHQVINSSSFPVIIQFDGKTFYEMKKGKG